MRLSTLLACLFATLCALPALAAEHTPPLAPDIPKNFTAPTQTFDYERREVMIPMRDGVKLHTVIMIPKGAAHAPIILTRTPYNASKRAERSVSPYLYASLPQGDAQFSTDGYIRIFQDVRGKYGSEGEYVMTRPQRGPLNNGKVDHSTDTWDTIDWLVKNVRASNGRVGMIGSSYEGFTVLMALVHPHPALKAAIPMCPMVDGWRGDDWFHNGAFRQQMMPYIFEQEATRSSDAKWWTSHFDDYDMFMQAGSAGELGRRRGLDQIGFWQKITEHPGYDAFWRDQAVDQVLAKLPLQVPVMLVHSLWDQEDIYGDIAVYKAIEPKDTANDKVFLVLGPWHHGQEIEEGSVLGALKFGGDTSLYFRQQILRPFLDQYLKDGAPKGDIAPVTAFETGTNAWRRLQAWPAGCASGCTVTPTPLYLGAGLKLAFDAPKGSDTAFDEYISDPAKPVPFRSRPIQPIGYDHGLTWPQWLVDDQREASGRPDVAVFTSDVLTTRVKISGQPVANLVASTTGTDADWVVKLIDVYPDEVAGQPAMGGYQLMVAADIFRGRYRESFETARPIAPDAPLLYRFALPTANHVFLPGHRIMVQVQSSWFPLYDRNPQTFVRNIFFARPEDFRKATQRVYHAPGRASFVELPLVATAPAS
jgi:putative CocE/NonD family hydrolase